MKPVFKFNTAKNLLLQATRGISFEDVISSVRKGRKIDDFRHARRTNQRIMVVKIKNYVYAVPYVLNKAKNTFFLKTIYPSRVLTKNILNQRSKFMNNKANPNIKLDKYEQKIEKALETGEYVPADDREEMDKLLIEAAENYLVLKKTRPITLRVNQEDLLKVKAKAEKSKIPYQTLLSSLIHRFAEGQTLIGL